jgi:hypothetical protein
MDKKDCIRKLLDQVLEQIQKDVADGDLTAIEEMLRHTPVVALECYLPEELTAKEN